MTYIVTANCDGCKYTDCVETCPVECFHEGPTMLYIDPVVCINCHACVPACPVEAIYAEGELPAEYRDYLRINSEMCKIHPLILEKKDPLPTARTLHEIESGKEN